MRQNTPRMLQERSARDMSNSNEDTCVCVCVRACISQVTNYSRSAHELLTNHLSGQSGPSRSTRNTFITKLVAVMFTTATDTVSSVGLACSVTRSRRSLADTTINGGRENNNPVRRLRISQQLT